MASASTVAVAANITFPSSSNSGFTCFADATAPHFNPSITILDPEPPPLPTCMFFLISKRKNIQVSKWKSICQKVCCSQAQSDREIKLKNSTRIPGKVQRAEDSGHSFRGPSEAAFLGALQARISEDRRNTDNYLNDSNAGSFRAARQQLSRRCKPRMSCICGSSSPPRPFTK